MAINPYKQIDFVFSYIKDKEEHSATFSKEYIWNLYVKQSPEMQINRMIYDEIMQKLEDDGYISKKSIYGSEQPSYNVTFKGRIFNGYENDYLSLNEQKARLLALEKKNQEFQILSSRNASKLNCLTLILAVGTSIAAIYYIFEILNHWLCIYPKSGS